MQELVITEQIMQDAIHDNAEHLERINETKHNRADQCMRREKLRKVNTGMMHMLKYLKALRSKSGVLRENVNYMKSKRAIQKWFART